MFPRRTTVTSHGKKYTYTHLVESYRREDDGRPTHRIIANLGELSDQEFENLKVAFAASKQGKRVVPATSISKGALPAKPTNNLRYLDVAVLLELWRGWGLDSLLDGILPRGNELVSAADLVAALAIQRCADPGSKLFATRWYPTTALPELLGVPIKQFNNTRVHRVLDALEQATPSLMSKLPKLYTEREGAFAALFVDVTDTWFIGHGPELAERAKTKEGLVERKIGIVLMCNDKGYPLRWEVIGGKQPDSSAMTEMLQSVAGLRWVGQTPVVVDRAMGKTAQISDMLATGLRFLTALTVTEFSAYSNAIPYKRFLDLETQGDEEARKQAITTAARIAVDVGMEEIAEDLFVVDLGVVERNGSSEDELEYVENLDEQEPTAHAMRLCRQINQAVNDGRYRSYRAAGAALGLHRALVSKYRILSKITEDIQAEILEGKAKGASLADIIKVAGLEDAEQQRQAFNALVAHRRSRKARRPRRSVSLSAPASVRPASVNVRAVAYFNPLLFVDKRQTAQRKLDRVYDFVDNLNRKLANPRSNHKKNSIVAAVDRVLRRDNLLGAFCFEVTEREIDGSGRFLVKLELDQAEWQKRRRYDGFVVLVAHPELPHSAEELSRLYRAKDTVEKNFQVIKSLVELRPIRHRTNAKVRAHVSICMLALLLERTLKKKLRKSKYTIETVLEILKSCDLNRYTVVDDVSAYIVTETTPEQAAILRNLRFQHLADDDYVAGGLTPR